MSLVETDTTLLKILIPIILLSVLIFQIWKIQTLSAEKNILFIDYFSIRSLEISFSLLIMYAMIIFLSLTILFAYNQLYINNKTCNPLMLYLGSKRACMQTNFENFENFEIKEGFDNKIINNETFTEKFNFLGNIVKTPFIQIQCAYLAIINKIYNTCITLQLQIRNFLNYLTKSQDDILYKIYITLIMPVLIKITNPIYKLFMTY